MRIKRNNPNGMKKLFKGVSRTSRNLQKTSQFTKSPLLQVSEIIEELKEEGQRVGLNNVSPIWKAQFKLAVAEQTRLLEARS
jgi:hypothetical protein